MELLEYLIQLRGAAATETQLKGIRDRFVEVGAAAKDAGGAAGETVAMGKNGGHAPGAAAATMGAAVSKIAKVGAVGLVALGLTAVKMSNTFSTEMLKIRTEGGATSKEFTNMRRAVINLATSGQSMGQGPTSLAQGLYHLESMGLRGTKAIQGLKLASEEAAISGASLEDTTTSLGGALFIAAKGTGSLKNVMGTLNAIAGAGNMRFQDLNNALGTGVIGSAKIAGVSLQELGASLDVLTDSGWHASSAGAQLGTALHYLYDPTTKAENALESIGLTGSKLAGDLRKPQGILAALRDLRAHLKGLSKDAQEQALGAILPGGRGRVLLNLYELQNRLAPKYKQVQGTRGDFGQHVAEQAQNPATKLAVAWAKVQGQMVKLGDTLTKYVTPAVTAVVGVLAKLIADLLSAFNWFMKLNPAAKALGTFIGILTIAFVTWRVATTAATIAMALFNAVMDANPISLVIIALAALAAGVVYAYNKWSWFRNDLKDIWSWIKKNWPILLAVFAPFIGIPVLIIKHWGTIEGFFRKLASSVGGIFTSMVNTAIIGPINWVIKELDKIQIHLPSVLGIGGGTIGFNIGQIDPLGGGGGTGAGGGSTAKLNYSAAGHQGVGTAATTTKAFSSAQTVPLKDRPLMITGDVVLKTRGHEIARTTRKQMLDAMTG